MAERYKDRKEAKADAEGVLAEFEARHPNLTDFCARTKSLLEACLQDANVKYQSVQARVKTRKKLREKYLDPTRDYARLDDITDLAGLRVITYYDDDEIDRVVELVEKQFKVDDKESVDKRNTDPDRFGYRAVNLICRHRDPRASDVEYKRFAGVVCEIQVTSILGHAWSEIEHEWYDLKDAYPPAVKRRFSIISALFELVGREFVDIRKSRSDYERGMALRFEAKIADEVPVDALSLKTFIEQEPLVKEIDRAIAEKVGMKLLDTLTDALLEYRLRAVKWAEFRKLQDLRSALATFGEALPEYVYRCSREAWPHVPRSEANPGISLHHLASLVAASQGVNSIVEFYVAQSVPSAAPPRWDTARQAQIAREVRGKFSL
jgi:putative GTP pyrophosphokinase